MNLQPEKTPKTKSVSKTLAILATFTEQSPRQRTSDIAAKLNLSVSTVSRHLNTLLDWGILERENETGYYRPGLRILELAGLALHENELYRYAMPELQQLSYKYDIHGHMGVPQGTMIIQLISSSCKSTMDLHIPMGHSTPMYCSALGRAILAYMPPTQVQTILKQSQLRKYASDTKVDIAEINQELSMVRQEGYCLLVNELVENKASLAAPIFNHNRIPLAAISVSTSARSLTNRERRQELAKAVINAASRISGRLGYYPN